MSFQIEGLFFDPTVISPDAVVKLLPATWFHGELRGKRLKPNLYAAIASDLPEGLANPRLLKPLANLGATKKSPLIYLVYDNRAGNQFGYRFTDDGWELSEDYELTGRTERRDRRGKLLDKRQNVDLHGATEEEQLAKEAAFHATEWLEELGVSLVDLDVLASEVESLDLLWPVGKVRLRRLQAHDLSLRSLQASLATLELERIDEIRLRLGTVGASQITQAGVAEICSRPLPGLRRLTLERQGVGNNGLTTLATAPFVQVLERLDIEDMGRVSARAVGNLLAAGWPRLEGLRLNVPSLPLSPFADCAALPKLRVLSLGRGLRKEEIKHLVRSPLMKTLRTLELERTMDWGAMAPNKTLDVLERSNPFPKRLRVTFRLRSKYWN